MKARKSRRIVAKKKMFTGANLLVCSVTCCLCASLVWWWRRRAEKTRKSRCLAIFTRYPTPGTTKTRLMPCLGERGAALVQLHMTEKMIDVGQAASQCNKDIDTVVFYNGGTEAEVAYWLERRKWRAGLSWRHQSQGDLGQKLTNSFSCLFREGALHVVAVGSDIPGITEELIEESFTLLESGKPVVLGEAKDGGYYLIGISSGVSKNLGALFHDIDWGTEKVFSQQMERAKELGIPTSLLPTALSDVDTEEDLPVFETAFGLSTSQLLEPRLSVVVPVYNEKDNIVKTVKNIIESATHKDRLEVIISDGGSKDGTQQAVTDFAATSEVPVTLVNSPPGRGPQLRYGATFAKGENLLFMHADSVLPRGYENELQQCLERPGTVAGAFQFDLDIFHPNLWTGKMTTLFTLKMKMISKFAHRRASKFELPYGDQGLFMTREMYQRVGGFQDVYLMEDFLLVKELQKVGHISIANSPVITSARRWREYGALKVTLLNNFLVFCYYLGVKPNTLARWYYGDKLKKILDKKES